MPTSYRIDPAAAEAVKLLEAPRIVTALDQDGAPSQHVLYLDHGQVRSMLLSEWTEATPPTWDAGEDLSAAIAARQAREAQRRTDAAALRQKVLSVAGSAVGQSIDTLTAVQIKALVACLLYRAGALDKDGAVQPLVEWLA